MATDLVVMLTNNDQTVSNAIEVFNDCKDLAVRYWGFKDIGLPVDKMKKLVYEMKEADKVTCLEVVSYSEEECLAAAKLAEECEFDYLMGTIFYKNVYDYIKDKPIKYTPFCGKVSGNPSILEGSIEQIIQEAKDLEQVGVDGFDLLAYRYVGDAENLTREFVKEISLPVCIAGSIDSYERIDFINEIKPWSITMGSALFKGKFVENGTFRDNLQKVMEYMEIK